MISIKYDYKFKINITLICFKKNNSSVWKNHFYWFFINVQVMKVKIFLNSSFVALDFKIVFVSFDDYFNSYFFLNSILTKYLLCGILPVNDSSFLYFKLKFKNSKYHSLSRPISQTHFCWESSHIQTQSSIDGSLFVMLQLNLYGKRYLPVWMISFLFFLCLISTEPNWCADDIVVLNERAQTCASVLGDDTLEWFML